MENENRQMEVNCPLCGSRALAWGEKNSQPLFRCATCRTGFVFPFPGDTSDLYQEDYFFGAKRGFGYVDYDADKQAMAPMLQRYLRLLAERRPAKGRLLDVGAATGVFVALAVRAGWKAEGVEISRAAVGVARAKGLEMKVGSIEDIEDRESFDAVTMFDVLEHLTDPAAAVAAAYRALKPGGILAVNVPDAGSVYARSLGLRWHAVVPPEHLWYFDFVGLSRVLTLSGFVGIEKHKINKAFSLPYFLSTAARWLDSATLGALAGWTEKSWLRRISLYLPLYDNLLVVARKPVQGSAG